MTVELLRIETSVEQRHGEWVRVERYSTSRNYYSPEVWADAFRGLAKRGCTEVAIDATYEYDMPIWYIEGTFPASPPEVQAEMERRAAATGVFTANAIERLAAQGYTVIPPEQS